LTLQVSIGMPSQAEHLYKATNNKQFADGLPKGTPTAVGWVLTILFYSALHYVEAYNARFNCHFTKHEELNKDIQRNPQLSAIFDDYRDLSSFSWNARYRPVAYGETELQEALECHEAVERHVTGLLNA
jgi:hypothetical protein